MKNRRAFKAPTEMGEDKEIIHYNLPICLIFICLPINLPIYQIQRVQFCL